MSPDKQPNDHELISAYLDGELHGDELARVTKWIASDPQYSQLLADLRLISTQIQELPQQTPAEDLTGRVLRQSERTLLQPAVDLNTSYNPDSAPAGHERGLLRGAVWGAAAVAAALLLSVFLPRDSAKIASLPSTVDYDIAETNPQQPDVLERKTVSDHGNLKVDSLNNVKIADHAEPLGAKRAKPGLESDRQFKRNLLADSARSGKLTNTTVARGQAREVFEEELNQSDITGESFPEDNRSLRRGLTASPNGKAPDDRSLVQAFNKTSGEETAPAQSDWKWAAVLQLSTEQLRLKTLENAFAQHAIDFEFQVPVTPAAPPGVSDIAHTLRSEEAQPVDAFTRDSQFARKYILVRAHRDQILATLHDLQDHLTNNPAPGWAMAEKKGRSSEEPHLPSSHSANDEMISVLFVVQIVTANDTMPSVEADAKTEPP
ncbi:MAG: hypothetical protein VYE64_01335 [Planctomycetota bacterium]|nr:hypothetical protein [Planctomycetota bacterium]